MFTHRKTALFTLIEVKNGSEQNCTLDLNKYFLIIKMRLSLKPRVNVKFDRNVLIMTYQWLDKCFKKTGWSVENLHSVRETFF
jgi:hypothetical protein